MNDQKDKHIITIFPEYTPLVEIIKSNEKSTQTGEEYDENDPCCCCYLLLWFAFLFCLIFLIMNSFFPYNK